MSKEKEIVIVGKIGDLNGLKEADKVLIQEQLEFFRFETGSRIRVRKEVSQEGTSFKVCVKSKSKIGDGTKTTNETEEPVTSSFFENFRNFAETLQIKKRYIFRGDRTILSCQNKEFQLPPITYEVDVFETHDGKISEWCKIDIEIQDVLETIKNVTGVDEDLVEFTIKTTHLPFKPQMTFLVGACTPEQTKALDELYNTQWTQTPFGAPRVKVRPSVSQLSDNSQQPETQQTSETEDGQQQTNESA